MSALRDWVAQQDARHRLAYSVVVATLAAYTVHGHVRFWTMSITAWDVFASCALALAWLTIATTPTDELRPRAREQDLSRLFIFVFLLIAACSSLFAVGFLLHTNKLEHRPHLLLHLVLSLFAVIAAWLLTHTVFGLRYAHTFYGDDDEAPGVQHAGGLEFPSEPLPNYVDFAYFAFTIGMCFQVSDVQVTSREIRQLVLVHGILSFAFNTVILALAINTASSLL